MNAAKAHVFRTKSVLLSDAGFDFAKKLSEYGKGCTHFERTCFE